MAQLPEEEIEHYCHSPAHYAVARHDYASLRRILADLPTLPKAGQVATEEASILAEEKADKVSAVVDRRDVRGRETPLHLAVRLGDAVAVEMLMAAGADWSLQNEQGWSALQEAVCAKEEGIAKIITRYYQPMAWAKWCRRLPRITGAMRRMRDFYMEITFNFESSVIPFIGRIAPSDTYRIWKSGSNFRTDMTLAGFDGFKIQRSDQTFLFLGDGTGDGKVPPGSLLVLTHKDKEVTNALEGAGSQPSEAEIAQEVAIMSKTNMYRPGIDVTQAELVPQFTWRRQERTEMVGSWKAKIFDMHHVQISVRSRRVPGAMTDEELFAAETEAQGDHEDDYADLLTEEEKRQLENVLSMETLKLADDELDDGGSRLGMQTSLNCAEDPAESDREEVASASSSGPDQNGAVEPVSSAKDQRKSWLSWRKKDVKHEVAKKNTTARLQGTMVKREAEKSGASTSTVDEGVAKTLKHSEKQHSESNHMSIGKRSHGISANDKKAHDTVPSTGVSDTKGKEKTAKRTVGGPLKRKLSMSNGNLDSEYKKGLRPILWLTPDFPLKTEELLPLLDILANKVKAIRRLRELLTTKLPACTFPVKVAIPIIPTIRVVVTFNKFQELLATEEFCTPLSSPAHFPDLNGKELDISQSSSSWFSWIKSSRDQIGSTSSRADYVEEEADPFIIPSDYKWIDMKEKKRRLKAKKAKIKKKQET